MGLARGVKQELGIPDSGLAAHDDDVTLTGADSLPGSRNEFTLRDSAHILTTERRTR
jgi:hypothetical protein